MNDLNSLFRKRIGFPETGEITFETLERILVKTAETIPFENLCVIEKKTREITKENLISKVLMRNEGGLCYDLNSLLYFFLIENGFNANMVRGVVYNQETKEYQDFGRTHVMILVTHKGQTYLVDTGFGANLPLKPVPLTGETVTSQSGEFRMKKVNNHLGDFVLEMKLKHKDHDWKNGYIFDSSKPVTDLSELNEVQTTISKHPESPFNKSFLVTRFTKEGNVILTNNSLTQWVEGVMTKEEIEAAKFNALAKQYFGISY